MIHFINVENTTHFQIRKDLVKGLTSNVTQKDVEGKKVVEEKYFVILENFSVEISQKTYDSIVEQLNK